MQQDRAQFQAVTKAGNLVARTTLQSAVDAADTSSKAMATAITMCHESWLPTAGFSTEVLPFVETHLFDQKPDESLHTLKDSRATLHSLGIYTPALKRKFHRKAVTQA